MTSPTLTPMKLALAEAAAAAARGEVPVGAVIVGAMLVIRDACRQFGTERLTGPAGTFDLYVTLEPCPMCAAAISFARLRRLYYAASDPKSGGVDHGARLYTQPTCHHAPDVYSGIEEVAARLLLKRFFEERR
jgi:tRNA(adenine34) deaminase